MRHQRYLVLRAQRLRELKRADFGSGQSLAQGTRRVDKDLGRRPRGPCGWLLAACLEDAPAVESCLHAGISSRPEATSLTPARPLSGCQSYTRAPVPSGTNDLNFPVRFISFIYALPIARPSRASGPGRLSHIGLYEKTRLGLPFDSPDSPPGEPDRSASAEFYVCYYPQ